MAKTKATQLRHAPKSASTPAPSKKSSGKKARSPRTPASPDKSNRSNSRLNESGVKKRYNDVSLENFCFHFHLHLNFGHQKLV